MRLIVVVFLVLWASFAKADGMPDAAFPAPIDVEEYRSRLTSEFPRLAGEEGRREAIDAFIFELEIFRVGNIEALNARILQICEELVSYERRINREYSEKAFGPLRKIDEDARISSERQQCDVRYATTSRYWSLYYSFFNLYEEQVTFAKTEQRKCDSNNRCRSGG